MNKLALFFIFVSLLTNAQIIVLDPGHGYCDDCTQNCTSNVRSDTEILTALAVGQKLAVLLQNCASTTVYFTRDTNNCGDFPSLSQRAAMSNSWGADRFLSIHCNAGGGTGTETFWCDNSTSSNTACQSYSEEIQQQMVFYGDWNDRRVVEDQSYLGFHLGVLSPTNAIGTLSEIGFVDSADASKLLDDTWRDNFALAYYVALQNELGLNCATIPNNDDCDLSTAITSSLTCNPTNGSVTNATADVLGTASCDAFGGTALAAGVFYNFTALQTAHTITVSPTATSSLDAVVTVYQGTDCSNLIEIDCLDVSGTGDVVFTSTGLTIGANYWVRIYDYGAVAPTNGDFTICVTHNPPSNDNCTSPILLTSDVICNYTIGTVIDATTDGIGIASCDLFGGTSLAAGVFYNFIATQTAHTITVAPTSASTLDAVVSIYSGTNCNDLTEIACLDPTGTGTVTLSNLNFTIGEPYWIRIYDYGSVGPNNGEFKICITHPSVPDIVVQNLYTIPENPSVGEAVDLYIDIKNTGTASATNFNVDFQINAITVGNRIISSIEPGDTQTEVIENYIFSSANTYSYCAFMTAATNELNTANNSYCYDINMTNPSLTLPIKVYLQGPLLTSGSHLMADSLRLGNTIPTSSPYGDAASCSLAIFDITGNNAIIDWVFIELRDAVDPSLVLFGQAGLLQADGDVVDTDGISPLVFNALADAYYIAVHHRNHLGIMTNTAIPLSQSNSLVDFSSGNQETYGTNGQTTIGNTPGLFALWAGNTNADNRIKFSGDNNDTDTIKDGILLAPGNIFSSITYEYTGYLDIDIKLDGRGKFSGSDNDADSIKDIILSHPGNIFSSITYSIEEQIP